MILLATGIFSLSPVRVMEMALSVSEPFPASISRLFDEASHEKISSVIVSV